MAGKFSAQQKKFVIQFFAVLDGEAHAKALLSRWYVDCAEAVGLCRVFSLPCAFPCLCRDTFLCRVIFLVFVVTLFFAVLPLLFCRASFLCRVPYTAKGSFAVSRYTAKKFFPVVTSMSYYISYTRLYLGLGF